jgi:zinc and cadmium transporter
MAPFASGGFIYIAATDLMPELHKRNGARESITQLIALLTGISLMSALRLVMA